MDEYLSELIRKCYIYRCTSRVQPSDSWDNIDVISHHQTTHMLTLQRRTSLMQSIRAVRPLAHQQKNLCIARLFFFRGNRPRLFPSLLGGCLANGMEWNWMVRNVTREYSHVCQVPMPGVPSSLHCIAPPCENTERWLGRDGELEWNG